MEARRMTQAEFMYNFNNENREKFNEELFRRDNMDIVNEVCKVIKSCERDKYFTLKVLQMNVIEDYETIYDMLREHEQGRLKKPNDENIYDYVQLRDSDIILLQIKYLIRKNGVDRIKINNKETFVENPEQVLDVLLALPRFVDKYYFRLSGNYYSAITQIVDGSTYNNATANSSKVDSVTLKTLFMSVTMFRMFKDVVDVNSKEKIRCILYTSIIFNSYVNAMYYIFAKYGYYVTMQLFGINCIELSYEPINYNNYCNEFVSFKKHNIYINCPKKMFEEPVIQSLCMTIYDAILKDTTIEQIYDPRFWLLTLGGAFRNYSIEKGLSALDSLESIYDITTKEITQLPEEMKANIYLILKWMMTDFSGLRTKDNTDVSIKRRRIAEYIAHVLALKMSGGIRRISDMGRKVKLKNIRSAIYVSPMYIISTIINMSNLIDYVDMVNDNDAITALKCTYKGISGLDGSVQEIYRLVDPTSIGILDPDTSSASDPGMTAMICPLTDTHGPWFTDFKEPNTWNDTLDKLNKSYYGANNIHSAISFTQPIDFSEYDYIKNNIVKENIELNRIICPIKDLNGIEDYSGIERKSVVPNENKFNGELKSLFTIIDKEE